MKFKVTLGLGRMANNHRKEYTVEAPDQTHAIARAKDRYHLEVEKEIGPKAPIWGKILCIDSVERVAS